MSATGTDILFRASFFKPISVYRSVPAVAREVERVVH